MVRDRQLKHIIRKGRLLLRTLDLLCNVAIVATVLAMLGFASYYADAEFQYVAASGEELTARVIPSGASLSPSRGLLGVAFVSLLLSILVMLGYLWSHKAAGKASTLCLVVELLLCLLVGVGLFAAASAFQIPKLRRLVRRDLWATFCSPIRSPAPGAPRLPLNIEARFYSLCLAGDWSVMCGFLSGALQATMAITLVLSLVRLYIKHKRRRAREVQLHMMVDFDNRAQALE